MSRWFLSGLSSLYTYTHSTFCVTSWSKANWESRHLWNISIYKLIRNYQTELFHSIYVSKIVTINKCSKSMELFRIFVFPCTYLIIDTNLSSPPPFTFSIIGTRMGSLDCIFLHAYMLFLLFHGVKPIRFCSFRELFLIFQIPNISCDFTKACY